MKAKTIESFSFGKVLISTTESLNGYWEAIPEEMRDRLIFQCNSEDEWVKAVNSLLGVAINRYNEEVIDVFNKNFSYSALLEQFKRQLL